MKRRFAILQVGLVLFIAFLPGCDYNPLAKISKIEKIVEDQSVRVEDHSVRIDELEKKLKDAELKLFILDLTKDPYKSATFDPAAGEGFSRIDTSVGTFAVSIQEVKPHADGVKVRLHIGNLTSAIVSGGTFKAKWGPRMAKSEAENGATNYVEWQKKLQEKESSFTEELRPGTWTSLTLKLPGIPPDQFGHLELSFDTSQIKLLTVK